MPTTAAIPHPTSTSKVKVVLIAGAGPVGQEHASALLDHLPSLTCPLVVCLRDADLGPLRSRLDGVDFRWAEHGASLDLARVWLAPPGHQTYVRDGRFEVVATTSGLDADGPSLGKIYHALRTAFGSRVFAMVVDPDRPDTPHLRLLSQRGARVVSPIDCGDDAVAKFWPIDRIVSHLASEVGARTEAVVA